MSAPAQEFIKRPRPGSRGTSLWVLLWTLYTTQFIGASFLQTGLTGILRDGGAPLTTLSTLQLLGLVWPVKFLWAPVLDRWSPRASAGHHRAWVLLLQSLMILSLLGLAVVGNPVSGLGAVIILSAAFVLFSATQDVAADALCVRGLTVAQHDAGAGVQVAASYVGTVIGGGLALLVYDIAGWRPAVLLLVLCTAVAMVPVWRFQEPRRPTNVGQRPALADMFGVLNQPRAKIWALVAVPLVTAGSAAVWSLVTPALVDAGWSLTRIGLVTAVITAAPALAAGLLGGSWCRRWGRAPTMAVGGALQLLGGFGLLPLISSYAGFPTSAVNTAAVLGACLILSGYTVMNTAVYAVNLDLSRPTRAGADFTLLSSISMLAGTVGAWAGLLTASTTGYSVAVVLGLAVAGAGMIVCRRHQQHRGV